MLQSSCHMACGQVKCFVLIIIHYVTFWKILDPCQVEFCVVKKFSSDIVESNCLPFDSFLKLNQKGSPTARGNRGSSASSKTSSSSSSSSSSGHTSAGMPAFPTVANPVHSQKEDGLEWPNCVLCVSKVAKVNIHPQEKLNNTFNVFWTEVIFVAL